MTPSRLLAISGSLRAGSSNTALLLAAARIAREQIVLYEGLADLPHFNPDLDCEGSEPPAAVALRAQIARCDGLIICSPEYAHGVPGALKNALDWLVSFPEFAGKPVLLWNASAAGGEHAQAALVEILRTMSARVLVEASLLRPFCRRKLSAGDELRGDERRAVEASLASIAAAVSDG